MPEKVDGMNALISERQWRVLRVKLRLTNREIEVAQLACEGLSSKGVAHQLGLKTATVSRCKWEIYRMLGVKNSVELFLKCLKTLGELEIAKEQPLVSGHIA
jgi:DNA-binding NarL/FixJ family response regulator